MDLLIEKYYNEVQKLIERAKADNIIIAAYYAQIGYETKVIDTGILICKDLENNEEYKKISTWR